MASGLNVKLPLLLFLAGLFLWTVVFLTGVMAAPANTSEVDVIGRRLYEVNCAVCHDKGLAEAPLTDALRKLTIDHISRSLNDGVMLVQSGHLTLAQRNAIADYLGTVVVDDGISGKGVEAGYCAEGHEMDTKEQKVKIGDWGFGLTNERAIEGSPISPSNVGSLELDWVFAFPNSARARSQPTVAGDIIFTGSHNGKIYALDLNCGCILWDFKVDAEVRSAISFDTDEDGNATRLYFADFAGNVYGFDIASRQILWKIRADSHPIATITGSLRLHEDTLYVPVSSLEVVSANNPEYECCTFRGSLLALDKMTGKERWRTYTTDEPILQGINSAGAIIYGPSGAPIWSSPTVDTKRGLLYVGTGENYTHPTTFTSDSIIALSLETGVIEWINQVTVDDAWNGGCGNEDPVNCPENHGPDYDFGAPPMLTTLASGKEIILAGQKSGMVYAMDPDNNGKLIWEHQVGRGGIMGGIHWGMATDGDLVYVPISDMFVYEQDAHKPAQSGLHALNVSSGELVWSTFPDNICGDAEWDCSPGISAAITLGNGVVFGGSLDGILRAFDASSGDILWEVETNRPFEAVNGIDAEGGSFDSDGPVIVGDRLLVTSGYDKWGQKFGNVLLSYKFPENTHEN
jgi:polyvinyl alcohol dehydrogenase (cytochrome)